MRQHEIIHNLLTRTRAFRVSVRVPFSGPISATFQSLLKFETFEHYLGGVVGHSSIKYIIEYIPTIQKKYNLKLWLRMWEKIIYF